MCDTVVHLGMANINNESRSFENVYLSQRHKTYMNNHTATCVLNPQV